MSLWSIISSLGYCGLWELEKEMSPGEGWMSAVGFLFFMETRTDVSAL